MTQTKDLIKKMADFFTGEEYYEKGEDARLELSPDDVRCMNGVIKACGNAISRQAVLESIKNLYPDMPAMDYMRARQKWLEKYAPYFECEKVVEQLPSVTPKQTEITLESAIDYLHSIGWLQKHDKELTESAQKQRTGHWILKEVLYGLRIYMCPSCGFETIEKPNYCKKCGLDMRGVKMVEPQESEGQDDRH